MSDLDFNKIMEAVEQGIVASKAGDSQQWGEWKEWRKLQDKKDQEMHDTLIRIEIELGHLKSEMKDYKDAKVVQNGRIYKLEEGRTFATGGIKVSMFLISIIVSLVSTVFWIRTDSLEKLILAIGDKVINLENLHISK